MPNLTINGQSYFSDSPPDTPLLWVIREELRLTGTKFGCGIAQCGACTVHINGQAVRSCQVMLGDVGNGAITTIEGLMPAHRARGGAGADPVQDAFDQCGALQCGFCQSGTILSARALLSETPNPSESDIRNALAGNLCMCTGYVQIVEAIQDAAARISRARAS